MHVIYTDGSASQQKNGPGGYAWVSPTANGRFYAAYQPQATSNRMELLAAWKAVRAFQGPILIVSDSAYVVSCFTDQWYVRWLQEGLLESRGKLRNKDLWKPLIMHVLARQHVEFRHVNGHVGAYWNEHADKLAKKARHKGRTFVGHIPQGSPRTVTIRRAA